MEQTLVTVISLGRKAESIVGQDLPCYAKSKRVVSGMKDKKNRKAEYPAQKWDSLFKELYHDSPIGIEVYDKNGNLVSVNPAARRIFGVINRKEVIGFNLFNDPNVKEKVKNEIRRGKAVKYIAPFDFGAVKKNKLYRTKRSGTIMTEVIITPINRKHGGIEGYIVQVNDVTERENAEKALRESEKRYRNIVSNLNDALYLYDFKGKILDANENACRMVGYKKSELIGASLRKVDSEVERSMMKERMRELIRNGKITFDGEHIRKDGTHVPVNVSASVISREGNGLAQSFAKDMTERKRYERELEKKLQQLNKLNTFLIGREKRIIELKKKLDKRNENKPQQQKTP